MRVLWMMALGAALACGQTSTQVFPFAHTAVENWQSIANAVRTVGAIEDVSLDTEGKALSVTGTADQIALAEFLFRGLDVDPQGPRPTTLEYLVPHASDDVTHVFYFNGLTPAQLQEIVNMVRTIFDITRIFQNLQAGAIAVRGTSAQIAAAAWLAGTVTQPATPGKHEYDLPPSADYKGRAGTVVRVFFLSHTQAQQDLQEIVNAVRTVADTSKMYQYLTARALVLRGHPEQVAIAEWLVDKLDRPAATQNSETSFVASNVFPPDTTAVRVFYVPSATSRQAIFDKVTAVRTATRINKIYPCLLPRAIALRGTDSQAAEAEALLK